MLMPKSKIFHNYCNPMEYLFIRKQGRIILFCTFLLCIMLSFSPVFCSVYWHKYSSFYLVVKFFMILKEYRKQTQFKNVIILFLNQLFCGIKTSNISFVISLRCYQKSVILTSISVQDFSIYLILLLEIVEFNNASLQIHCPCRSGRLVQCCLGL